MKRFICITIEENLLNTIDKIAEKEKRSRSNTISILLGKSIGGSNGK